MSQKLARRNKESLKDDHHDFYASAAVKIIFFEHWKKNLNKPLETNWIRGILYILAVTLSSFRILKTEVILEGAIKENLAALFDNQTHSLQSYHRVYQYISFLKKSLKITCILNS